MAERQSITTIADFDPNVAGSYRHRKTNIDYDPGNPDHRFIVENYPQAAWGQRFGYMQDTGAGIGDQAYMGQNYYPYMDRLIQQGVPYDQAAQLAHAVNRQEGFQLHANKPKWQTAFEQGLTGLVGGAFGGALNSTLGLNNLIGTGGPMGDVTDALGGGNFFENPIGSILPTGGDNWGNVLTDLGNIVSGTGGIADWDLGDIIGNIGGSGGGWTLPDWDLGDIWGGLQGQGGGWDLGNFMDNFSGGGGGFNMGNILGGGGGGLANLAIPLGLGYLARQDAQPFQNLGERALHSQMNMADAANQAFRKYILGGGDPTAFQYGAPTQALGMQTPPTKEMPAGQMALEATGVVPEATGVQPQGMTYDMGAMIPIRNSFGLSAGQEGFDPAADLNNDQVINMQDLAVFRDRFGTTVPLGAGDQYTEPTRPDIRESYPIGEYGPTDPTVSPYEQMVQQYMYGTMNPLGQAEEQARIGRMYDRIGQSADLRRAQIRERGQQAGQPPEIINAQLAEVDQAEALERQSAARDVFTYGQDLKRQYLGGLGGALSPMFGQQGFAMGGYGQAGANAQQMALAAAAPYSDLAQMIAYSQGMQGQMSPQEMMAMYMSMLNQYPQQGLGTTPPATGSGGGYFPDMTGTPAGYPTEVYTPTPITGGVSDLDQSIGTPGINPNATVPNNTGIPPGATPSPQTQGWYDDTLYEPTTPNQGGAGGIYRTQHYADGGIAGLHGPEFAMLGEKGPEIVIPLGMIGDDIGETLQYMLRGYQDIPPVPMPTFETGWKDSYDQGFYKDINPGGPPPVKMPPPPKFDNNFPKIKRKRKKRNK